MVWEEPRHELDRWVDGGLKAKIWVRDDDAIQASQNLERLRNFAVEHRIKIGLATIPGKSRPDLSCFLDGNRQHFFPMCHGWQHINHNLRNAPAEFGRDRPLPALVADARSAFDAFQERFGTLDVVFVPPFNRLAPALMKVLLSIGFVGLSSMPNHLEQKIFEIGVRLNRRLPFKLPAGLTCPRVDTHIDVINWKAKAPQMATTVSMRLAHQLRGRRLGLVPIDTPIGLLLHHLDHDEQTWQTCDETLRVLREHPAVDFIDIAKWANDQSKRPRVGTSNSKADLPSGGPEAKSSTIVADGRVK
jgi:hypothetical protein